MAQPIFAVGDRVRMRHSAPYPLNATGTVTRLFGTALGYYDVKFDTALGLRVCYADAMEHCPEEVNLEALFWTDDGGDRHRAPTMRNLPPLLQLGINRMIAIIAGSPAAHQDGKQTPAQAIDAVNILLCVLLPRLPQEEIDRHPYNEKRHFVECWFDYQKSLFLVSA